MRQRTIREGSVGLLIVVGVGLFGGVVLWLRGATFGQKTYSAIVEFASVEGMQIGADVRYRGVDVGGITAVNPASNGVEVTITIVQPDLLMPKNATIEANQSGLVGATSIDIIPLAPIPGDLTYNALSAECDRELLICDGSRLEGVVGVSYLELLREGLEVSRLLSSEEFYTQLISTLEGATAAAESFTSISGDLSELMAELSEVTILAKGEISTISNATQSVGIAADSIRQSTLQVADRFTQDAATLTQNAASLTAQVETTSVELQRTLANLNGLMTENRSTLTNTLANLEETSEDIQGAVSRLTPIISEVEQSQLLGNLETLSNNAAQASANLREISNGINNPNTLLMLQQTLDSARSTFQNTQKLTSDIDDLLGDPEFRDNIRDLVDGLGDLFSSTEELENQTQIARVLAPIETELNSPLARELGWSEWQQESLTETELDVESEPVEEPEPPLSVNFQLNSTSLFETKPEFQSHDFTPEIDFEN